MLNVGEWCPGALLEPTTDRRWSWFVGSKANEERSWSFVYSSVVERDYVTVLDSNIGYSRSVVIRAVVSNRNDIQTQCAVTTL